MSKLLGRKDKLIALKDFKIYHPKSDKEIYERDIKKGDDLSDVPDMYLQNLKTEKVI